MKHDWYRRPQDNILVPEAWRCRHCPSGSFSAHLLDLEAECPQTGAPDYDAEEAEERARYWRKVSGK